MAGTAWLNPLNKMAFQKAIKNKQPQLILKEGTYLFNYVKRPGWVWISKQFATSPCGWFNIEEVLKPHWLADE